MRRRVCLWGAAAFAVSSPLHAQPRRKARIGFLADIPRRDIGALFTRLAELGWSEIRNLRVEYLEFEPGATNHAKRVEHLVRAKCDLIVAFSTPAALAVKTGAPSTPLVFTIGGDPVALGLVRSLARPGGQATGQTQISPETSVKQLALLREVAPRSTRVAVMFAAANPTMEQVYAAMAAQQSALQFVLLPFRLRDWRDIDAAELALLREPVDGLVVLSDPVVNSHRPNLIALAARRHLPAVYGTRYYVEEGGLMAFGTSWPARLVRTAEIVARILDGAKPADIPVERPTKFELLVNLHTAEVQGIDVPQTLLLQATEVIR